MIVKTKSTCQMKAIAAGIKAIAAGIEVLTEGAFNAPSESTLPKKLKEVLPAQWW